MSTYIINAGNLLVILSEKKQDACGSGGLVQLWNLYGGGLIGEFNTFDYSNETTSKFKQTDLQSSHSITAL